MAPSITCSSKDSLHDSVVHIKVKGEFLVISNVFSIIRDNFVYLLFSNIMQAKQPVGDF